MSSRVSPASSQRILRDGPTYTINWTAPLSPRLLVESTVAYQDLERGFFPMFEGMENSCAIFGALDGFFLPLNTARCFNSHTGFVSGSHHETWDDRRQRLTVMSTSRPHCRSPAKCFRVMSTISRLAAPASTCRMPRQLPSVRGLISSFRDTA